MCSGRPASPPTSKPAARSKTPRLYLTVERNRYHFSFRENLNKRYADRRANIKNDAIDECVRSEIQKVFAGSAGIERIFSAERSNQVPDRPALTFVVLSPEQSMEDHKRSKGLVESLIRECGTSPRTFNSALVFCVARNRQGLCVRTRAAC